MEDFGIAKLRTEQMVGNVETNFAPYSSLRATLSVLQPKIGTLMLFTVTRYRNQASNNSLLKLNLSYLLLMLYNTCVFES